MKDFTTLFIINSFPDYLGQYVQLDILPYPSFCQFKESNGDFASSSILSFTRGFWFTSVYAQILAYIRPDHRFLYIDLAWTIPTLLSVICYSYYSN